MGSFEGQRLQEDSWNLWHLNM